LPYCEDDIAGRRHPFGEAGIAPQEKACQRQLVVVRLPRTMNHLKLVVLFFSAEANVKNW
jgi:hypothetical protein